MRLVANILLVLPLVGIVASATSESSFPLVEGRRQAVLVGTSLFLKGAVARCTGVSLKERPEAGFRPRGGVFPIYLGASRKAREILGREIASLDVEGYILHVEPSFAIIYAGPRQTDTGEPQVWAEAEFARRFMGVDHYFPGALGEVYPQRAEVRVPCGTWVENPAFKARHWSGSCGSAGPGWRVRASGGGGRFEFHHALWKIIDPVRYKDHPEYFPEHEGRRVIPTKRTYWQPCTSHPDVQSITVEYLNGYFAANPRATSHSLGVNDSGGYCECRTCLEDTLTGMEPRSREAVAHRFFKFYNAVAAQVAVKHPDVRLGFLAYGALGTPAPFRLHPLLMPYLTQNQADAFDPAYRRRIDERFEAWSAVASHLGMYEYLQGGGFIIPRLYSHELARGLRAARRVGVDGVYAEAYPNWALDGPKLWIAEKLLWNPDQDVDALLEAYCGGLFGGAAPAMRDYFNRLERAWMEQRASGSARGGYRLLGTAFKQAQLTEVFPPNVCEEVWALLAKAEIAAEDEAVRARVRFFKTGFGATRLAALRLQAAKEVEALATGPDKHPLAAWLFALDQWARHSSLPDYMELARTEAPFSFQAFCAPGANPAATFRGWDTEAPAIGRIAGRLCAESLEALDGTPPADKRELDRRIEARLDLELKQAAQAGASCQAAVRTLRPLLSSWSVDAVQLPESPVIDGRVEHTWGNPAFDGHFFNYPSETWPATERTRFWVGRRGSLLYVAFACEQEPATVSTNLPGHDAADFRPRDGRMLVDGGKAFAYLNNVDSVGVALPDQRAIVMVTSGGGVFDGRASAFGYTPDWNGATARVLRTETGWSAEVAIELSPGSSLPHAFGAVPGFNFFRVRQQQRSAWVPAAPSKWSVNPGTSGVVFFGAE